MIPLEQYSAQAVANIVNAYAKASRAPESTLPPLPYLSPPPALATAVSASVERAAGDHEEEDPAAAAMEALPPVAGGAGWSGLDVQELFEYMSAAARQIDLSRMDMQNVANMANAFAKVGRVLHSTHRVVVLGYS